MCLISDVSGRGLHMQSIKVWMTGCQLVETWQLQEKKVEAEVEYFERVRSG